MPGLGAEPARRPGRLRSSASGARCAGRPGRPRAGTPPGQSQAAGWRKAAGSARGLRSRAAARDTGRLVGGRLRVAQSYAPFCFPIRFAPIIFALLLLLRHFPNCCFWAELTARSACRCRCLCWSRAAARDAGGLVGGRLSGRLTLVCSAIGRSRAAAAAVPAPSLPRVCVFCVLVLCSGVVGADEGRCTTNNEYAVFDTAKLFVNLHKHAHTLLEVGLVAPCVAH